MEGSEVPWVLPLVAGGSFSHGGEFGKERAAGFGGGAEVHVGKALQPRRTCPSCSGRRNWKLSGWADLEMECQQL